MQRNFKEDFVAKPFLTETRPIPAVNRPISGVFRSIPMRLLFQFSQRKAVNKRQQSSSRRQLALDVFTRSNQLIYTQTNSPIPFPSYYTPQLHDPKHVVSYVSFLASSMIFLGS